MKRRAIPEQEAMRQLATSGFLFIQEGDPDSGDLWLRILQQKPDRYGQFHPIDLTSLDVYQDCKGNLVVDGRVLRRILEVPSQLPGDVVPESRLELESSKPFMRSKTEHHGLTRG